LRQDSLSTRFLEEIEMKLNSVVASAAVFAALSLVAAPVHAQRRGQENRGRSAAQEDRGRSGERARGRADAPRQDRGYQAVPRVGNYERPRTVFVDPYRYRSYGYGSYGYRSYGYRPYTYAFRPRLRIGFGIYLGYPVPYSFYDPYAYPAPAPVYGYPAPAPVYQPPGGVTAAPGYQAYGGVSFDLSPSDATVYVDGSYVGIVSDFSDPSRPLSLSAGPHRVELRAPGYVPMIFDVDIVAGQVLPYRGELRR
jgi:hypothetical protein